MHRSAVSARRFNVAGACVIALCAACGGTRVTTLPRVSKAECGRIVPDWYVNPPRDEKLLAAQWNVAAPERCRVALWIPDGVSIVRNSSVSPRD